MHARDRRDLHVALASLLGFSGAIALGYWGWSLVHEPHPNEAVQLAHHFLGRAYLTLQLFVLHPQDLPRHDPWQLELARFLAPVTLIATTLYVLTFALRTSMRERRIVRSRSHVIVCGAGVHGARLTQLCVQSGTPVIVVDISKRAPGMQGQSRPREVRLIADTVNGDVLRRAGVSRASKLIAVTGDDVVNAQIASTVRDLAIKERWERTPLVLIQAEDRVLARFLEDSATGAPRTARSQQESASELHDEGRLEVRTFGANTLAAVALFGGGPMAGNLQRPEEGGPLADIETSRSAHLVLVGDHGLLEALVVTALRRGRARRVREPQPTDGSVPLRITLVGKNAGDYGDAIRKRWQLERGVIEFEARDVDPRTESSLLESFGWAAWRHEISHALVACEDEHASISIAVTLSRVVGPAVKLIRVATQPHNELDRQLEAYARGNPRLAKIEVHSIVGLAWGEEATGAAEVSRAQRLQAALREEGISDAEATQMADRLLGQGRLQLYSDAAPRITSASAAIVTGMLKRARGEGSAVSVSALIAAGLSPDVSSLTNLRRAAEQLSLDRSPTAFTAWCEYARVIQGNDAETSHMLDLAASAGGAAAPLRLKAAALGAAEALDALKPDEAVVQELQSRASRRIAIFAGAAGSMSEETTQAVARLLKRTLYRYDGLIITGGNDVGVCGAVRDAAEANGVPVLGYAPAGCGLQRTWLRSTPAGDFGEAEPTAMWTDILSAAKARGALTGTATTVRVVVFPGGAITRIEIILARALGAAIASLDPCEELIDPLDETLPFGSGGVLGLPTDAMTLRAFLMWPNRPLDPSRRLVAARELHNHYRRQHVNNQSDPALVPWERLSTTLRRSNLAAVDDIPNKLDALGKRLCIGGERLVLQSDQIELLAEMEHGRYNCERLITGWELGRARQGTRLVSPFLLPWCDLEHGVKQWDRDAVMALGAAIQRAGWGVAQAPRRVLENSRFASVSCSVERPHESLQESQHG